MTDDEFFDFDQPAEPASPPEKKDKAKEGDSSEGGGQRRRRRRTRRPSQSNDDNSGGGSNSNSNNNNSGGSNNSNNNSGGGGSNNNNNNRRGRSRGGQSQNRNYNNRGGSNNNRRNNNNNNNRRNNSGQRATGRVNTNTTPIEPGPYEGLLELHPKGYGFLRSAKNDYASEDSDPFVSSSLVEKYNLREGVKIFGEVGPGSRGQGPRLKEVETIDQRTPEEFSKVKNFEDLTPINPFEQIKLETGASPLTMRVMDLLTPIGKGQRALIVAPPRTGKTMLLQDIANSVSTNHPEVKLIVLLIDERPEEVTEMRRTINGEVIASSMDREVESHIRTSQLIFERGKRIAESGGDAFILLDSITRTARAFNKWIGNTGRTMSGGLDVKAMDIPKKMFGMARRFDEGGSLTVVGTALIETGSRMDDVIFQEFKGTGNMEMVLSRDLSDRRIWPAIDIGKSGTRREEKILAEDVLDGVTMMRRSLVSMNSIEAMEQLIRTLERFPTNQEFLSKIRAIL